MKMRSLEKVSRWKIHLQGVSQYAVNVRISSDVAKNPAKHSYI